MANDPQTLDQAFKQVEEELFKTAHELAGLVVVHPPERRDRPLGRGILLLRALGQRLQLLDAPSFGLCRLPPPLLLAAYSVIVVGLWLVRWFSRRRLR